jgi:regulator of cell morphogenesis and NO signaling
MSTMTIDQTVGELVVERPARARVFEQLGIDYCCGGRKPLAEACSEKGLSPQAVLEALEDDRAPERGERNWATASMTDLCDHIEQTHHEYLRQELPRLEFLTSKVAMRHGDRLPKLVEVRDVLLALKAELEMHMMKEERILFPLCRQFDTAQGLPESHCGSVNNPIAVMIREHEDAGDALARLRELTDGYAPPADACNTFRAMYDSLHQLERDMHQHVHKENNILFPRAARAESLLLRAGRSA